MPNTPKSKTKPSDDVSVIHAKAMDLRIEVLRAKELSDEVSALSGQAILSAREVFEAVREEENAKMLVESQKVEATQATLVAYGAEADKTLGVTNALGALLGPVGGAVSTPQVSL